MKIRLVMIRVLNDKDFLPLLSLYIEMYKVIDSSLSTSVVTIILCDELKQPDFIAYGVFHNDTLVGFLSGYTIKESEFFNSGLYCSFKTKVQGLFAFSENDLRKRGYTSWSTEARGHIKSLAPKLGAKIEYIKYKKEL
jgi:hypothetical protein